MFKAVSGIIYPQTNKTSLAAVRELNETIKARQLSQDDGLIFEEINGLGAYAEKYAPNRTAGNLAAYNGCLNHVKAMLETRTAYATPWCDIRLIRTEKGDAPSTYPAFKAPSQKKEPNYRISPQTIELGNQMVAKIRQVVFPATHDKAVAEMDKVKTLIKSGGSSANISDADFAVLKDIVKLYTFATYMYDTRNHWKQTPTNLLLMDPYSACEKRVQSELKMGVAMTPGGDCDLRVIGEENP